MKSLGLSHCALSAGVAAAVPAGCGGTQPSVGAPGAMPQSRAIATHTGHGGSWMLPEAKRRGLLYISSQANDEVYVVTYPKGELVATLAGFEEPSGLCSDNRGNVFVTDDGAQDVVEYAHGGSSPIATLNDVGYDPVDCSFDPTTGNLAVVNFRLAAGGPGNVAIYANEQGTPTFYSNPQMYNYLACSYDNKGNLFLDASYGESTFAELPSGSRDFENFSLPFTAPGGVQWDGTYVAIDSSPGGQSSTIYRVTVSGSKLKVIQSVPIERGQHNVGLRYFWLGSSRLVGPFANFVGLWPYPLGGEIGKLLHPKYYAARGVTVSFAP
jgi:hypothetical protein